MIFLAAIVFSVAIGLNIVSKQYGLAAFMFVFWLGWMIDRVCEEIKRLQK